MPIRVAVVVVNTCVLAWFLMSFGPMSLFVYRVDFDVYRLGAQVWLDGGELYGRLPNLLIGSNMPFTYPPIAAVVFTPFAALPFGVAGALIAVLTIAGVAVVLHVTLRSLDLRVPVLWLLPAALFVEPVRTTVYYGQINVLLLVLVVLDCLVRTPRWPRGLLIGIAAAVKLTPAVFVLFFLLRGDKRAAGTAAASFAGASALGFLLAPGDSVRFWTEALWDTERVGDAARVTNQSIKGMLARFGVDSGAAWLLLVAAVMVVGALLMRRALAAGQPTLALCVNALAALPITPVSWCHHWVWLVPVLVTLWAMGHRALVLGGLLLFTISPHWWGVWPMLTGSLYVAFAVVALWSTHRQLGRTRVDVHHRAVA